MEEYIEDSLAVGSVRPSASPAGAGFFFVGKKDKTLRPSEKCEFHCSTIYFLGYIIAEGNVQMDPEKVRAVVDWPEPMSRVQLQWFLGFANFYWRFIRGYSNLAAPLSALTSPKVPFTWSPAADKAFGDLKQQFTTAPILIHPDPTRQFVVEVDTSDMGVGIVLSQRSVQDQKLHPCAFMSHRLSPAERNYDVGNRELLVVKMALEEWRPWPIPPPVSLTVSQGCTKHTPRSQGLLRVWPARPSAPGLPHVPQSSGKLLRVRIDRGVRTPGSLSQPPSSSGGAHRHRRQGSTSPRSRRGQADVCHVPVTVEGVPCSALVDTGSTVTLVRPDIMPGWTQFEFTTVQLHTVTGKLATMKGKIDSDSRGQCVTFPSPSVTYGCVLHSPSYLHDTSLREPGRAPPAQLPQMGEERTLSAQERLWQLLLEFRDSFALSEEEVGQTHLVQPEIDTGDARPIKMRSRHILLARQEATDKAVLEMQRADFIEPSDSPQSSWFLRRGLDLVRGSSWFSSLDLSSGYWQVPLSPEARAKTVFSTNRGNWQFKVLCFGLCNTPATFQCFIDRVLDGIPRQQCLVYLDDILAHGSSFQSALGALRRVLEQVAAGLKLHPEKCHFMRRKVSFLGHRVGKEGISTMEDKVGAIRDWPTLTDQHQLKSFLGLASYYRRFVRDFSSVAAPLNRLLPKDKAFTWTVECEEAFNTLKLILDTDTSNVGMGGVLAQVGPEGERVVAHFSKTFDKHERRYCVTRRELLAVVASIKHFKYYLGGLPFTVRTDHSALQWLMSFREPEVQVAHWSEELQPYDFTVVHRAVACHSNADAMSRRPCTADGCRHCERREGRERELCAEEGVCATVCWVSGPVCCELQTVDVAEWGSSRDRTQTYSRCYSG
eukprot:XP_014055665.1 PREDICTED: uncharacterized protein LOC106604999 [Salmo salar]